MMSKNLQKFYEMNQLNSDIQEINNFLSKEFDRPMAIYILKKHHFTDLNIAITDMILNINETTLLMETPEKILRYIICIRMYLINKLQKLLGNKV